MKLDRGQFRISITTSCNMKCVYCHNEGNSCYSTLSVNDIDKILSASYDIGLSEVRLTGGDPLLNPDILNICKLIHEKYNLQISINTNCILIDRLLKLIDYNYISRVIVGLDYYDNDVSKNSPIGLSSREILNNILKIKERGVDVSISTVFNENYEDIEKIVNWGIENFVRIKIIEIEKNEISNSSSSEYLKMQEKIINQFNLSKIVDDIGEVNGYVSNFRAVSFFHSLCRLRQCDICKKIQNRITSNGIMKACLYYSNQDENLFVNDTREKILKFMNRNVDYHYNRELIINEKK